MRPHGTRESKTRSGAGPEEPTAGTESGREGRRGRWRRSRHAGDAKLNESAYGIAPRHSKVVVLKVHS